MAGLGQLIESLASEDAPEKAVANRIEIMRAVNEFLGDRNEQRATLLWLIDRNQRYDFYDCTLWSIESQDWSGFPKKSAFYRVARRYKGGTYRDAIKCAHKDISIGAGDILHSTSLMDQLTSPTAVQLNDVVIPIGGYDDEENAKKFVGFIQVVAPKESLVKLKPNVQTIISKIIHNRIAFGRRQRTLDAVRYFQSLIGPRMNEEQILDAATDALIKYTTLERICIYFHTNGNQVRKTKEKGPNSKGLRNVSKWVRPHICDPNWRDDQDDTLRVSNLFDVCDENEVIQHSLAHDGSFQVPKSFEDVEVAMLLAPIHAGESEFPPMATIKAIVSSDDAFLGGCFSQTDCEIVEMLLGNLLHLLPGVITRSRREDIERRFRQVQHLGEAGEVTAGQIYKIFPQTLVETLPAIDQAWAYIGNLDEDSGVEEQFWISDKGKLQANPFALPSSYIANPLSNGYRLDDDRWLHCESVMEGGETLRLYWVHSNEKVLEHDLWIVKQVASDMRLRALGRLDVQDVTRQIAELRHAVKASITGVIGSVNNIEGTYEFLRTMPREERDYELFRRAHFRKEIRSLKLASDITLRFFESLRITKLQLTPDDLKPGFHDPNIVIENILRMMRPLSARRRLKVEFLARYPIENGLPFFDQDLIHVAVANMIENAIKYARRNTVIFCETGIIGDQWFFAVQDTGRWVSPRDRNAIFNGKRLNPFPGEVGQPGTGMGLPAVKRIVRAHDPEKGREEVSSMKTGGTKAAPTAETRVAFRLRRFNSDWNKFDE